MFSVKKISKAILPAGVSLMVLASAISPALAASSFSDVPKSYEQSVNYLVDQDITNGMSKTKFGVSQNIKRGDATIILAHALRLTEKDAPSSGFVDVPTRGVVAINALKNAGIINGKSAKKFGFNELIKRGEMALMLTKASAYNLKGDKAKLRFNDVNSRYADAVAALVDNQITAGKSASEFGTDDLLKRGEYAVFMYKAEQTLDRPTVALFNMSTYKGLWESKRANSEDEYLSVNIRSVKGNTAFVQVDSMSRRAVYIGSTDGDVKFVSNKARLYYGDDGFGGSGVITLELKKNEIAVTVVKSNEIGYIFEGKYRTYKK